MTEGSETWLAWIEETTNKEVVDYSNAITEASQFADPIHLNSTGAERLAELMVKRGEFSDSQ